MLCGGGKKSPWLHLSLVIFFWSWSNACGIENWLQLKPVLFILVWLLSRDRLFPDVFILCIFFWSWINDSTFSVEDWIPLRHVLCRAEWEVLHFSLSLMSRHKKTGLQFSFSFYFGLVALEGSAFYQNFYIHNNGCQVLCGGRKTSPRLYLSVAFFPGPSGSLMTAIYLVLSIEYRFKSRC